MTQFEKAAQTEIKCDICGAIMCAIWGGGWDNDRVICSNIYCKAEIVFPTSTEVKKMKKSKWRKLNHDQTWAANIPMSEYKGKTFLLYDKTGFGGIFITEAIMGDDGFVICPSGADDFRIQDFSHWRPMIKLPED